MFGAGIKLMDEDEDFFGNLDSSRSNLSEIFGSQSDHQHSLKYIPQKQKHNPPDLLTKDRNPGWNIQIAKVVTAYKLVNEDNSPQGRIGLAVLKSPEGLQKIILYRSKNHVLSTTSLTDDMKLYLKNSYLQFVDDLQVYWSILFENGEENTVLDLITDYIYKEELNVEENKSEKIQDVKENPSILTSLSKDVEKDKPYLSDDKNKNIKENILSRISKMGQALPTLNTQTTTDLSDSSDTEIKKKSTFDKPVLMARKPNKIQQQIIAVAASNSVSANNQMISTVSYNPQILQHSPQQESQYLNMLLSENRSQNTEVRMNISKLETKIEKVLDRIDLIKNKSINNNSAKDLEDEILVLEEKVLGLKKENRILRQKIDEFTTQKTIQKIKTPPITPLLNNDDFKEFEDLIKSFDLDIDTYVNSIDLLQEIIRNCIIQEKTLKNSLEFQERNINDIKNQLELLEKEKGQQISDLRQQIEHLESKIMDLENLTETLRKDKEKLFEKLENSDKTVDNVVKTIMNNLYQNLVNNFGEEDKVHSTNEILKVCANVIKQQTKIAINERKNDK